ncbi:hypothetical protein D3C81_1610390 [compost metagenome]
MRTETGSYSFNQRSAFAFACAFCSFLNSGDNSENVHAVNLDAGNTCCNRFVGDRLGSGLFREWCSNGIAIVLYEEDYRQFEASGKVQAFIEVTFGRTAVTCISNCNILLLLQFEAHCDPGSVQNLRTDDDLWH